MISPAKSGCQLQKGLHKKKKKKRKTFINMRNSLLQAVRKDVNQSKSHRLKQKCRITFFHISLLIPSFFLVKHYWFYKGKEGDMYL